jgi:hypothetical protein
MIDPWSNAHSGSSSTECQAVSDGSRGRASGVTSARYAVGGQVPARGRAEPFAGEQQAARQRPRPLERHLFAAPQQHGQSLLADLEHDPKRLVTETVSRHRLMAVSRHRLMVGRARTRRLPGWPRHPRFRQARQDVFTTQQPLGHLAVTMREFSI